ncbi:hypothetical protein DLAC_02783 [Tieghemostelium lacteum]|uniref:Uncharacterized protein n=1 Tax=Tieghemostelium lacteum TaxID=361077 RepID=A0A152A3W3_TIELA|nr:hypothetical protein DLAC_02783 [Tieghemostelium lacteum]|eukprot:KYR00741.1 hypothetical protein DLAC_02783 [Tieghemostelium lacteum]
MTTPTLPKYLWVYIFNKFFNIYHDIKGYSKIINRLRRVCTLFDELLLPRIPSKILMRITDKIHFTNLSQLAPKLKSLLNIQFCVNSKTKDDFMNRSLIDDFINCVIIDTRFLPDIPQLPIKHPTINNIIYILGNPTENQMKQMNSSSLYNQINSVTFQLESDSNFDLSSYQTIIQSTSITDVKLYGYRKFLTKLSISDLKRLNNLSSLTLYYVSISNNDFQQFSVHCHSLEKLSIDSIRLETRDYTSELFVKQLSNIKSLKSLKFHNYGTELFIDSLVGLINSLHLLHHLSISCALKPLKECKVQPQPIGNQNLQDFEFFCQTKVLYSIYELWNVKSSLNEIQVDRQTILNLYNTNHCHRDCEILKFYIDNDDDLSLLPLIYMPNLTSLTIYLNQVHITTEIEDFKNLSKVLEDKNIENLKIGTKSNFNDLMEFLSTAKVKNISFQIRHVMLEPLLNSILKNSHLCSVKVKLYKHCYNSETINNLCRGVITILNSNHNIHTISFPAPVKSLLDDTTLADFEECIKSKYQRIKKLNIENKIIHNLLDHYLIDHR